MAGVSVSVAGAVVPPSASAIQSLAPAPYATSTVSPERVPPPMFEMPSCCAAGDAPATTVNPTALGETPIAGADGAVSV